MAVLLAAILPGCVLAWPQPSWPFFPFQNALTDPAHPSAESQVRLARSLGYDGIGSVYPQDLAAFAAAADREGIRLFNTYVVLSIDGAPGLDAALKDSLAVLAGRQATIWLGLTSRLHRPGTVAGEPEALRVVGEVADLAEELGAAVALYPHDGFWIERTSHAMAVANQLNRPHVGVSFNLCHFLKVEEEARLEAVLREAAPRLLLVSLNGAESGRTGGSWAELIQPLDRGSFDNRRLLRVLREIGYDGPIGFQGYGIQGRAEETLGRTLRAWRDLNRQLQAETPAVPGWNRFRPAADGGFTFDTGRLRGRLRAGGRSVGLTRVHEVATGARLDQSYGLLSHYRVFTQNRRYGDGAWDWPSTARLLEDGSVAIERPAAADRPFVLRARYAWSAPGTIVLGTEVEAVDPLPAFESFIASYFDAGFSNAWVRVRPTAAAAPEFLELDPGLGEWLMFPRDADARALIEDGRWRIEPHPVEWAYPGELAGRAWTGIRFAPTLGLAVRLTADRDGCFALSTPHQQETHYSGYFSLFGRDLAAGESARTTVWLVFDPTWDPVRAVTNEAGNPARP